jgi:NAD(P)H-hydrate repair Nnr-like enzyme with NAD(P)H-hydrate epimerase domain
MTVVLDREPTALSGVPGEQLDILGHTDASVTAEGEPPEPSLVVDALLGYGLRGAPRDRAATLVEWTASVAATFPLGSTQRPVRDPG